MNSVTLETYVFHFNSPCFLPSPYGATLAEGETDTKNKFCASDTLPVICYPEVTFVFFQAHKHPSEQPLSIPGKHQNPQFQICVN